MLKTSVDGFFTFENQAENLFGVIVVCTLKVSFFLLN